MRTSRILATTKSWRTPVMVCALVLGSSTFARAQTAPRPMPETAAATEPKAANCASCCNLWEVAKESICGTCCERIWQPLCLDTLFSEGWCDAWIAPPDGCSGAPRQGWINTFDGFFTREWHLAYAFTNNLPDGSDAHLGLFTFNTPLSRRLWLGIDVPFITSLEGGADSETAFGDVFVTPKVMLQETQNMSLSAGLTIQIPTGSESTGGDLSSLFPHIDLWTDIGGGWSLRGGTGFVIPTEESVSPDAVWVLNASIGQTVTCHDNTPLGDFTYYLAANLRQDLGATDDHTFVSFTPGIRTHLGNNYFFLAGVEVPVTGPQPFDERIILVIVKGF